LGGARSALGALRVDPGRALPAGGDRAAARRPAPRPERRHLPDALGLSVEPAAGALRRRRDGAPLVPALGRGGRAGRAVGALAERVRGARRRRLALAGGGRLHGQSPLRRRKKGPNPTDRAKAGTKKSLIVERSGGPLGVEIDGANVHDTKLLEA